MRFDFNYCGHVSIEVRACVERALRNEDFATEGAAWEAIFAAAREDGLINLRGAFEAISLYRTDEVEVDDWLDAEMESRLSGEGDSE